MDDVLEQRFDVYYSMPDIDSRCVDYIRGLVQDISVKTGAEASDDNFGTLVSHFVMALDRAVKGTGDSEPPSTSVLNDLEKNAPTALAWAREIVDEASAQLQITLTDSEVAFLALHLGVLQIHQSRKNHE